MSAPASHRVLLRKLARSCDDVQLPSFALSLAPHSRFHSLDARLVVVKVLCATFYMLQVVFYEVSLEARAPAILHCD